MSRQTEPVNWLTLFLVKTERNITIFPCSYDSPLSVRSGYRSVNQGKIDPMFLETLN